MVTGAMDSNKDHHGCISVTSKNMALDSCPGTNITTDPDGKQAIYISLLFTFLAGPDPLSPRHINLSTSLSLLFLHPVLSSHDSAQMPKSSRFMIDRAPPKQRVLLGSYLCPPCRGLECAIWIVQLGVF